ncbi:MAG: hypothetical protein KJ063_07695 [Anaerolineae bacterium]|nr:hypothetical protein [Anaerolineae bacterium]
MLQNISLDTSFWVLGTQIGIIPYLFLFFRVHYCQQVEQEIVTTNPNESPLIFPQAILFMVLQQDGRLHKSEPTQSIAMFGPGESHAIALALENKWALLINDVRPLVYAQSLGIPCVTVPDFCLLLYTQGKITYPAIQGYLQRLVNTTSPRLIDQAKQAANYIANQRGDRL